MPKPRRTEPRRVKPRRVEPHSDSPPAPLPSALIEPFPNGYGPDGKFSPKRVFGIPLPDGWIEKWIEKYVPVARNSGTSGKRLCFFEEATRYLPDRWQPGYGFVRVPMEDNQYWDAVCLVIGSNFTPGGMEAARDKSLVEEIKRILPGPLPDPGWYRIIIVR